MTNRRGLCAVLVLLMAPAMATSGPARTMGDDGANSPESPLNRTNKAGGSGLTGTGSAMDLIPVTRNNNPNTDGRPTPYVYDKFARDPVTGYFESPLRRVPVTIGITPGTSPGAAIPTAAEWLAFLRDRVPPANFPDTNWDGIDDRTQSGVKAISSDPPRQKVHVVDQGYRKDRIVAGLPPEQTQTYNIVTTTRWTEAVPRYENRTVVGYPCCCNITFSLLVGYDYYPRVTTSVQTVSTANYAATDVSVNRGIVVIAGNPQYSTIIPKLCEFHYGAGAVFTAPVVPLITNVNDQTDITVAAAGTNAGTVADNLDNVSNAHGGTSTYVEDVDHNLISGGGTSTSDATGYISTTVSNIPRPLIPGTGPSGTTNFGGVTFPPNERTIQVTLDANNDVDRGVHTFPGDRAIVQDSTITRPAGSTDPYAYHNK